MSILQRPPSPSLPVICDFFFEQTGPKGTATYDGDIYPYPPLPGESTPSRYEWGTTPVFLAVEFFGIAHEVESKVQPHVIPPPGISILEYFWDFGDGYTGHGPIVTHTYEVPDPNTAISLTVLDSLGREFSTSKALSLVIVDFGYIYQRIRGQNTETPPKYKKAEASGDFALTIEGTPTVELKMKSARLKIINKAVSNDRASVTQTHFVRHTSDMSLSSDRVTRTRNMARFGGKPPHEDISLSTDTARSNVHRYSLIEDESLSSDSTGSPIHQRPLRAKLSSVGKLPKQFSLAKKLKAALTSSGKLPY
jgi:hypothetical protein